MPRPRICRRVSASPNVALFKPAGIPGGELERLVLGVDEFEALRLVDFESLEQGQAALKMGISQPTLSRLVTEGRRKVAEALVLGKAIEINGGNCSFGKNRGGRRKRGFCRQC